MEFRKLLSSVFGSGSSYEVYGDFEPLDAVTCPAYYVHIVKKQNNNGFINWTITVDLLRRIWGQFGVFSKASGSYPCNGKYLSFYAQSSCLFVFYSNHFVPHAVGYVYSTFYVVVAKHFFAHEIMILQSPAFLSATEIINIATNSLSDSFILHLLVILSPLNKKLLFCITKCDFLCSTRFFIRTTFFTLKLGVLKFLAISASNVLKTFLNHLL